ncbi:universal stress protein [Streptomyces fructofermentans]|uniref:universal stress protein n=1 Tax=Streptomyces fructofermentans TaxID=152141 RepID=UPI003791187B
MTQQHVVAAVDGSLFSVRALDQAAHEAARRGAALRVLYAVSDRDEAGPVLASAAARVRERHPGLPVETRAVEDDVVRALVRESANAVLTVVGTRGLGGLAGFVLGAVSTRLASRTRGPLMVVRGSLPRGNSSHDDCRDVLLGLADDTDTEAAVYALREAEARGARLRVLHSPAHRHTTPELPSPFSATSPGQRRQATLDRSEEAVTRFALAGIRELHPSVEVDSRTVRTAPAPALVEATRDAAVVVVGSHRRGTRHGGHPGPITHALLHGAHCPVVIVPVG